MINGGGKENPEVVFEKSIALESVINYSTLKLLFFKFNIGWDICETGDKNENIPFLDNPPSCFQNTPYYICLGSRKFSQQTLILYLGHKILITFKNLKKIE